MRRLADVKDTGGKYIAAGRNIPVRIAEAVATISSKGSPCRDVWFENDLGQALKSRLSLADNALWKVKSLVAACGIEPDKLDLFDVDSDKHWQALVGRKLYIDVVKVAKNGKEFHDVDKWYSLAGNTMQAAQRDNAKSIEQRLLEAAEAPIAPSYGPPDEIDDIPF